jgi:uncharacterized membrane protein (UPF0127 family)
MRRASFAAGAGALLLLAGACHHAAGTRSDENATAPAKTVTVTIRSSNGAHIFTVETARTAAEQEQGLMFRTDIAEDGGMLFAPYPPGGGPPQRATFWMKNTPSPLDIVFIRPDHTIARIAENAVPFDESPIASGEPVTAVLELKGGRTSALGIAEGDKVSWAGG